MSPVDPPVVRAAHILLAEQAEATADRDPAWSAHG
jgi:hypothetical protein